MANATVHPGTSGVGTSALSATAEVLGSGLDRTATLDNDTAASRAVPLRWTSRIDITHPSARRGDRCRTYVIKGTQHTQAKRTPDHLRSWQQHTQETRGGGAGT